MRSLVCFLVFIGVAASGCYGVLLFDSAWKKEQKLHLNQITNAQASAIERRLGRSLSATYLLSLQIRFANGNMENFNSFADETIKALGGISNLQLAPNGVIERIYPLAGNEKAIGHNLLKDDKRREEAELAIRERRLTVAGPFELVQGGVAVIGRNPVFISEEGKDKFWGFASALIFLEDLLAVTDLEQLEKDGYGFTLERVHPDTGSWEIFSQSEKALDNLHVSFPIIVPNSSWRLTLSRPLPDRPLLIEEGFVLSILLAAMLASLLAYIMREPDRLRAVVADKTEQLNELAFYDVLTGLVNRRLFMEQLEYEVKVLQRTGKKAALMYLDLDDFKRVNDSLGHAAGDRLLVEVAQRLQATMRESDIICRLGGDEYAILMMNVTSGEDCQHMADKLISNVRNEIVIEGVPLRVSLSIGITLIPDDSSSLQQMLSNADIALYESKKLGKNRATFFNHDLQKMLVQRLQIEQELKFALEHDELELYFQPIVRLDNRQIVMLEALIRWNHPEKGLVSPMEFICVAEQCGLIIPIGDWVLEEACRHIRQAVDQGEPLVPIAVNISAHQFVSGDFADKAKSLLESYQVDPAMIEFEITETVLMENLDLALEQMNELRQIGCRFAIDDFGMGYSSLAQLKQLPVDTLKVDRTFVRDIEHDHHDRQIVEAIIAMAHRLGLHVIAEGVENQSQLEFIDQAGGDMVQGFLFSKPVPYSEVYRHELLV
ncbi:bifunctional diguanylate cyclase/phosphodiesterase [Neptuniibacter halophilus]|uniref:bifunctional diguanylate cyclase/phosphodiesterase n=1 Tax=Neptuniibacter halophilus TaxID=651666 RepID=UPI0025725AC8|nr:EAL domain-containing protein [Neptuniibacter halophilus]